MDEQKNIQKTAPIAPQKPASKKPIGKIIVGVVILLLLTAIAILAFLFWQEKNKPAQVIQPQACKCEEPKNNSEPVSTTSSYTADIGKFSLSLKDYVIVRKWDGAFEGGPITSLSIGQKSTSGTNVIDNKNTQKVDIIAQPLNGLSFEEWYQSSLTDAAVEGPTDITIDGVTTKQFTSNLLFNTKQIFFQKAGIAYSITAEDVGDVEGNDSVAQKMLGAVIANWNFTN